MVKLDSAWVKILIASMLLALSLDVYCNSTKNAQNEEILYSRFRDLW